MVLLQGRFDPDNFSQEVADVAQKLVPLTVTLWNKVSAKMLPTPAKFHYLFNMRELSKVNTIYNIVDSSTFCVCPRPCKLFPFLHTTAVAYNVGVQTSCFLLITDLGGLDTVYCHPPRVMYERCRLNVM